MACAGSWACLSRCAEDSTTPEVPLELLRAPAVRARGEQVYRENCALCHGENADGRGVRAMGLDRKPANFTDPLWSRPGGASRAYHAITHGVPGTAMPAWGAVFGPDDRWALVAFISSVSQREAPALPGPSTLRDH
jgi:mono/diheme cytochrome c family protein